MRFTDSLTVFIFILNSVYCTLRRFPHRLTFSAFKTLTWFISFTPFFDRIRTTGFLLLLPCSHGLLVRFFIYLLSCQYRNPCKKLYSSLYFVALYFTRLLLSGFSLCITRIKNLFFWKEIDKTFLLQLLFQDFKNLLKYPIKS